MKIKRSGPKTGTRHHPKRCLDMMPGNDKIIKPKCTELGGESWRRKRLFCLLVLATLAVWLNAASSWAADSPCVHSTREVRVRARALPVMGSGLADHTYVTARERNAEDTNWGPRQQWGCFGRDTGGRLLTSVQSARLDTDTICFMASQSPCKWPAVPLYAVVGVCHQLSNRGLYTARTTVLGAHGYGLSRWFFGPYGKAIRLPRIWRYRMSNCRTHANVASGFSFEFVKPAYAATEDSKEYLLFEKYLGKLKDAEAAKDDEKQYKLMNQYRREVVAMHLDEAGAGKDAAKKALDLYDKSVPKIEVLMEARLQEKGMSNEGYLKQMNALLKGVQDDLKKVLPKKVYEQFTDAPYDKTLVWEDFMDKPTP